MTIWQEARSSIRGIVRLARFDPAALDHLNLTLDGYWRSFFAAVLLAPLYVILWLGMDTPGKEHAIPLGRRLLVESINYPLSWTLWPLVAFYVARSAGWGERYLAYITAYNWAQIFTSGIMLVAAILIAPAIPADVWLNLWLMMAVVVLAFEAYIARRTLGITWFQAGALEALLFVVTESQGAIKDFVLAA